MSRLYSHLCKGAILSAICGLCLNFTPVAHAATPQMSRKDLKEFQTLVQKMVNRRRHRHKHRRVHHSRLASFTPVDRGPYFDIPVTYNNKVKWWINYFQTGGRKWFRTWLERSHAYMPLMQQLLKDRGLPQDLAFVAMIESGFSAHAVSSASAVGYWQFIKPTAHRYGLKTTWWLDERKDFTKSTSAAAHYLGDLYKMFGSWYLTAAAYNMGEGRMKRLVKKYHSKNFWELSRKKDFPEETQQYIPKLIAAMLIAKAPRLYGFDHLRPKSLSKYVYFTVPGGTDLVNLAQYLKVQESTLASLNPALTKGFVPSFVKSHRIRIPRGTSTLVSEYIR